MKKNNKGFIDLLTILVVLILCVGTYFWVKDNNWNVEGLQSDIINRIDDLSYKENKISEYINYYKDLSCNLKDSYLKNIDVPELSGEIKNFLVNHKDDGWEYVQNPEVMVLSAIVNRCVKNDEVVPECREFFNQLSDIVVPVGK